MYNHINSAPKPRSRTSSDFIVRLWNNDEGHAIYKEILKACPCTYLFTSKYGSRKYLILNKVYRAKGIYYRHNHTVSGWCHKHNATHFDVYIRTITIYK
jgi:hypothetical protein